MFTPKQWSAFALVIQEGKTRKEAAERLGVSYQQIKDWLDDMKKQEPELFPTDFERIAIRRRLSSKERKRYNHDVVSFDARKDGADNVEDEIRKKF